MTEQNNLQAALRQEANKIIAHVAPSEREALLIKNWMSHDARWFMAVANEYGMGAANRLNKIAAHAIGTVELQRITRALQLAPITTLDEYLLTQEILIGLLGPDLIDYEVSKSNTQSLRMRVQRCFAYDNAMRASIAGEYECGILARVTGWLEALGLKYEIMPSLGNCLQAQGQECIYTITLNFSKEE